MFKHRLKIILLLVLASQSAWAQLSVSPKRVIFEGRERSQELLLLNTGETSKKYRIYFRQLKMTQEGGYEPLDDSTTDDKNVDDKNDENHFASQAVRFSPRQVTLAPGMTQTIRLLVRKPKGFTDGEYRSHLTFSEIPDDNIGQSIETPSADQGFAFQMRPLLGMSIPIIIRQGKLSQAVEIKQASIESNELNFELHRKGLASVYGLITATFTPKDGSPAIEIGRIKGVSVLTPLEWRSVTLPLSEEIKGLSQGELQITYSNLEEKSAKRLPILSQHSLKL